MPSNRPAVRFSGPLQRAAEDERELVAFEWPGLGSKLDTARCQPGIVYARYDGPRRSILVLGAEQARSVVPEPYPTRVNERRAALSCWSPRSPN